MQIVIIYPKLYATSTKENKMDFINFIIALVALVIALFALQRSGGMKDLKESTASMLGKMEQALRKEEETKKEENE